MCIQARVNNRGMSASWGGMVRAGRCNAITEPGVSGTVLIFSDPETRTEAPAELVRNKTRNEVLSREFVA